MKRNIRLYLIISGIIVMLAAALLGSCARPKVIHPYDTENIEWMWVETESGYTVTASFVCTGGEEHTQRVPATVGKTITKAPTYGEEGTIVYTASVSFEGKMYTDRREKALPMLEYDTENVEWAWEETENGYAATASFRCIRGEGDTLRVPAEVRRISTREPSCEQDGELVYTAEAELGGELYTDRKTKAIPALGHVYREWIIDEENGRAAKLCERDTEKSCNIVVDLPTDGNPENWSEWDYEVTKAATCEESGIMLYTYKADNTLKAEVEIFALGHDYEAEWIWTKEGDRYAAKVVFTCRHDKNHVERAEAAVSSYVATVKETCDEDGSKTYTAAAELDGKEYTDSYAVVLPALGHDYGEWTIDGNEARKTCSHQTTESCTLTVALPTDGNPENWDEWDCEVLKEATCEEAGLMRYTYKEDEALKAEAELPAAGHDWGEWLPASGDYRRVRFGKKYPSHFQVSDGEEKPED